MSSPLAAIGAKELQVPSGFGVFPVRTLSATFVSAVVSAFQPSAPQLTPSPASKTREWNVPEPGYGLMCIQSTDTSGPIETSLAITLRFSATLTVWVATRLPSTKYLTSPASHSMRYRCGEPIKEPGTVVVVSPPGPASVRARTSFVVLWVLNIANALLSSSVWKLFG